MRKVVLFSIMLCSFVTTKLVLAEEILIGDGTVDSPYMIECTYCVNDWQFQNIALANTPDNQSLYFLGYNLNSQLLRTVQAVKVSEDGPAGFSFERAFIRTTTAEHQTDFEIYLSFLNSGLEKSSVELEYPASQAAGFSNLGASTVRNLLPRWAVGQVGLFSARKYSHIDIKFDNGDVAKVVILTTFKSTAGVFVAAFDKDGNVIGLGNVSAQHTGGGASAASTGGYTTVTLSGGVKVCYGACPVREGIITITRNDE